MHLDESARNDRARQGAEYYHSQLSPFVSVVSTLLDSEIDNKETAMNIKEKGKALIELLAVKVACLDAVIKHGYSVQTVQKAKTDQIVNNRTTNRGNKRSAKMKQSDNINDALADTLRRWRAMKSKDEKIPAYMVLQQKALPSIASNMPRTPKELKNQLGVGTKTLEKYGNEILEIVSDFLNY
jgi:superfamily II DNA helicase RecQ